MLCSTPLAKLLRSVLLGTALLAGTAAVAGDWQHRSLSASDGTTVRVDFTLGQPTGGLLIAPCVWVNLVTEQELPASARVRVVTMVYGTRGELLEVLQNDLWKAPEGHFTGEVRALTGPYAGAGIQHNLFSGRQEMAFVIDGVWLKDSGNPLSSNFRLDLASSFR
jgi:hypothetical protein